MSSLQPWISRRLLRHLNQIQTAEALVPNQSKTRSLTSAATPSPLALEKAQELITTREGLPRGSVFIVGGDH